MRIIMIFMSVLVASMLTGCFSYDLSRKVVQQGNLLPENKIQQIKPGMSKERVAVIMGTSLLSPMFSKDRWDYAYTWRRGSGSLKVRNVVVYFSNGVVRNVEYKV